MSVITHVTGTVKDDEHVEMRFAPSGVAVLSIRFSKNVGTKDKPEWNNFKAVIFGKQAESLSKFVKGGTSFSIVGRQKVSTYEKRDGGTGVSIELIVIDFDFAGAKQQAQKQEETQEDAEPEF